MLRRNCGRLRLRTHFDVLSVPIAALVSPDSRSHIDPYLLQKRLHALQRRFHPDSLSGKSQAERDRCEIIAGRVNSAYRVVRDDFMRHRYIAYCIALFNQPDTSANAAQPHHPLLIANDLANKETAGDLLDSITAVLDEGDEIKLGEQLDAAFLESMMDLHEEIEEAAEEKDGLPTERRKELQEIVTNLARDMQKVCEHHLHAHGVDFFVRPIENFKPNVAAAELSEQAKRSRTEYVKAVMRWTYAANLQQKLKELE